MDEPGAQASSPVDTHLRSSTPFKRSFDQLNTDMDGVGSSSSNARGSNSDAGGNKRARSSSPLRLDQTHGAALMATSSGSHAFLAAPLSNLPSSRSRTSSPPPGTLLMISPGLLPLGSSHDDGASPFPSSGDGRTIELDVVTSSVSVTSTFPVQIPAPTNSVPSVQFASPASTATMTSGDSPMRSTSHPPARPNSQAHREALESVLARAREFQETVDAIRDSPLPNEPQPISVHRPIPNRSEVGVAGLQSAASESGSSSPLQVQYNPRTSRTNSGSISPTLSSSPVSNSPILDFGAYDEYILHGLDGGDALEPETTHGPANSIDVYSPYRYGESDESSRVTYLRRSQSSAQRPSPPIVSASSERSFGSSSSLYARGPYPWRRAERLQSPATPSIPSHPLDRSQPDSFRSRPESRLSPPSSASISSARPPPPSSGGDTESRSPFITYLDSSPNVPPSRDFHVQHTVRPSLPPIRTSQNGHTIRNTLALDAEIDRLHRLAELADQAPRLRYSSGSSASLDHTTDGSAPPRGGHVPFAQPETRRSIGQGRQHEAIQEALSHLDQTLPPEARTRRPPLPSDDDVLYAWEDAHTASSRTHHSYRTSLNLVRSGHRRVETATASLRDLTRASSPAPPRVPPGSGINPSRRPISLLRSGTTSTSTPAPPLVSHSSQSNPPRLNSPVPAGSPRFPPALGPFASRQPLGNSAPRDEAPARSRTDSPPYTFAPWAPPHGRNISQDPPGSLRLPPFEPVPPPFWTNGDVVLERPSQSPGALLPDANPGGTNHLDRRPTVRFVNGDQGSGSNDRPFWPSLSSSISSRIQLPGSRRRRASSAVQSLPDREDTRFPDTSFLPSRRQSLAESQSRPVANSRAEDRISAAQSAVRDYLRRSHAPYDPPPRILTPSWVSQAGLRGEDRDPRDWEDASLNLQDQGSPLAESTGTSRFTRSADSLGRRHGEGSDEPRTLYERWTSVTPGPRSSSPPDLSQVDATLRRYGARGVPEPLLRALREYGQPRLDDLSGTSTESSSPISPINPSHRMDVDDMNPTVPGSRVRARSSIPEAPRLQPRTLSGPGFDDVRTGYTPPVSRNPTLDVGGPPVIPPLDFMRSRRPGSSSPYDDERLLMGSLNVNSPRANILGMFSRDGSDQGAQTAANSRELDSSTWQTAPVTESEAERRRAERRQRLESINYLDPRLRHARLSRELSRDIQVLGEAVDEARQATEALIRPQYSSPYRYRPEPLEPVSIRVSNDPPSETAVDGVRRHVSVRTHDESPSETAMGDLQRHLDYMRDLPDRQFSHSSWDNLVSSNMSLDTEDPPGYSPTSDEFRREMERERMRLRERRRLRDLAGDVSRVATGVDRIMNYMGRAGRESDAIQEPEQERRGSATTTGPQPQRRSSVETGRRGRILIDEVHLHDPSSAVRRDRRTSNRSPPPLRSPSSSIAFETVLGRRAPGVQPRPNSPSPSPAARLANRLRRTRPTSSEITDASVDDWLASWPSNGRSSVAERAYIFGPSRRRFGDYLMDGEFDQSYEGLLRLSARIGEARPTHTPADVIASLPKGVYKDFPNPCSETRCPICLDDYQENDGVLAVNPCSHFFHVECLQQWLQTSRSCPNCRALVTKRPPGDAKQDGPSGSGSPRFGDAGPSSSSGRGAGVSPG